MNIVTKEQARLDESFAVQLAAAQAARAEHFIDQDTKTLIRLDGIGEPVPFSCWVRSLRIQRQAIERRWYRRIARAIARLLGRNRIPAPAGDPRARREGQLGCDGAAKNFTIIGDREHD